MDYVPMLNGLMIGIILVLLEHRSRKILKSIDDVRKHVIICPYADGGTKVKG
jgi:hypothetical protein